MEEKSSTKRPAKRRRRRPRRIFGLWPRLIALAAFAIILVVAAVALVGKIARPYNEGRVQARQLAQTEAQIASVRAANAFLTHRVAYLNTPEGTAAEARAYGYVRPGEHALIFPLAAPAAAPTVPAASLPPPSVSERARGFWRRLTGKK